MKITNAKYIKRVIANLGYSEEDVEVVISYKTNENISWKDFIFQLESVEADPCLRREEFLCGILIYFSDGIALVNRYDTEFLVWEHVIVYPVEKAVEKTRKVTSLYANWI